MDDSIYDIQRQDFYDRVEQDRRNDEDYIFENEDPLPVESMPIPDTFISEEDEKTGMGEAAFDGDN